MYALLYLRLLHGHAHGITPSSLPAIAFGRATRQGQSAYLHPPPLGRTPFGHLATAQTPGLNTHPHYAILVSHFAVPFF